MNTITTYLARSLAGATPLLLVALLVGPLHAQQTGPEQAAIDAQRAALQTVHTTGDFVQAARTLSARAQEMTPDHGETARSLQLAGRLYHHGGELELARRALVRAGTIAYEARDPVLSVQLFLNAAVAAQEDGAARRAWHAAELAGFVIRTGEIDSADRMRLLRRIVYPDQPVDPQPTVALARP